MLPHPLLAPQRGNRTGKGQRTNPLLPSASKHKTVASELQAANKIYWTTDIPWGHHMSSLKALTQKESS